MSEELRVEGGEGAVEVKAGEEGTEEGKDREAQTVEFHLILEKGNSLPYKYKLITYPQYYEDWQIVKAWIEFQTHLQTSRAFVMKDQPKVQIAQPGMMNSLKSSKMMRKIFR